MLKAVVLAGGKGVNMLPLSYGFPKVLLRVAGKPVIDYCVEGLARCGVSDFTIVVSDPAVEEYVRDRWGTRAAVAYQRGEGIEAALLAARRYVEEDEAFILAYADIVAPPEFYELAVDAYASSGKPVYATVPMVDVETYGVAIVDVSTVRSIIEKPEAAPGSTHVLAGLFILPTAVFELLDKLGSLPATLNALARETEVEAALWTGDWVDLGYPWDLISANYVALRRLRGKFISSRAEVSPTAVIEGPVVIEEGAVIDHYAVIKGPAYIGPRAFVGKGALIRSYTDVEEHAVIGAFAEVKRSSLQPHSSVGSYTLLSDSALGEGAVVGPRVTTLSKLPEKARVSRLPPMQGIVKKYRKLGSYVAPRARVKACALLEPGTLVFPDGSTRSALSRSAG